MAKPELNSGPRVDPLPPSVIVVDDQGNAETKDSRVPHPIIQREHITPQNTLVRIDLDKLTSSTGEHTAYIVLSDFGLPFRTVEVTKAYPTDYRYASRGHDPKYAYIGREDILVSAPDRGWEHSRTQTFLDGEDTIEGDVPLSPGQHLFIAHLGDPSDLRTGFIYNDTEIVVFPGTVWDSIDQVRGIEYHTPFLRISYEGRFIVVEAYDDSSAEVIYEKLVSDADMPDEPGKQRTREEVLEAALARSKEHLVRIQAELQNAKFENERLRQERQTGNLGNIPNFDYRASEDKASDPYGYCHNLFLDPDALFSMPPDEAVRFVSAARRALANIYHEDVNPGADKTMLPKINDSADRILTRLRTGFWGRN